jgi:NAD(P)-dependent dehydrogenase (short-subunit alcohol dehydrogenase family)
MPVIAIVGAGPGLGQSIARRFAGDVLDRSSLTAALAAAARRLGQIDVLEYSPATL